MAGLIYFIRRIVGSGADRRTGSGIYHAVPSGSTRALCGKTPSRASRGWSEPGQMVTCTVCAERVALGGWKVEG